MQPRDRNQVGEPEPREVAPRVRPERGRLAEPERGEQAAARPLAREPRRAAPAQTRETVPDPPRRRRRDLGPQQWMDLARERADTPTAERPRPVAPARIRAPSSRGETQGDAHPGPRPPSRRRLGPHENPRRDAQRGRRHGARLPQHPLEAAGHRGHRLDAPLDHRLDGLAQRRARGALASGGERQRAGGEAHEERGRDAHARSGRDGPERQRLRGQPEPRAGRGWREIAERDAEPMRRGQRGEEEPHATPPGTGGGAA